MRLQLQTLLTLAAFVGIAATVHGWGNATAPADIPIRALNARDRGQPSEVLYVGTTQSATAGVEVIVQKPLFFPGRAFPKPPVVAASVPAPVSQPPPPPMPFPLPTAPPTPIPAPIVQPEPPLPRVHGLVVETNAGSRRALLSIETRAPAWLEPGDKIGDWIVGSIEQNDVEVRRNGITRQIHLYTDRRND